MSAPTRPVLVFATHNPHKVREIQEMLADRYEVKSLSDIGCHEDIVEDADTLEGNARIKAHHVVNNYGLDCFADDTGLEVDALNGAPGVFSARYAGTHGDTEANMAKLLRELDRAAQAGNTSRQAQFKTVICLVQRGQEHLMEGVCRGRIEVLQSGTKGFGYDPLFRPEGHEVTFAEMDAAQKNEISHRGRAVRAMLDHLLA